MHEKPRYEIENYGLKGPGAANAAFVFLLGVEYGKIQKVDQINNAILTDEEKELLTNSTIAALTFISDKHARLGINDPDLLNIPDIIIAEHGIYKTYNSDQKGVYQGITDLLIVTINDNGDLLDTATTIAHEVSHATTKTRIKIDWTRKGESVPDQKRLSIRTGLGIEFRTDNPDRKTSRFIAGIDNGLAIMDQIDIYYQYLKDQYPDIADLKRQVRKKDDPEVQQLIFTPLHDSIYGPYIPMNFEPFINFQNVEVPNIGLRTIPNLQMEAYKSFLLTRELCFTLGHSTYGDELSISKEEYIQLGRDLLDRDRYTKSNDALKALVKIFGRDAYTLFTYNDDFQGTDKMMEIVRAKQQELGIYTPPAKK